VVARCNSARGETVQDVRTTATARVRELSRGRGRKTDVLDATAAAGIAAHQPFQEILDQWNARVDAFWRLHEVRGTEPAGPRAGTKQRFPGPGPRKLPGFPGWKDPNPRGSLPPDVERASLRHRRR
jgi:hypothetical protein